MAVYKNISGQTLHIGSRIIQPFQVFEVKEESEKGKISEEQKAVEKALKEGLLIKQITEVKPKNKKQPLPVFTGNLKVIARWLKYC
jgi:nickel-dependent lactate racemase